MRLLLRFALIGLPLGFLAIYVANHLLNDLWGQYAVTDYVGSSLKKTFNPHLATYTPADADSPAGSETTTNKVIVMAKTTHKDTSWVSRDLPDWQNAIYTVDASPADRASAASSSSSRTTPANKGHEAMAYLTYIIDNYAALPDILTFLHPHRSGFFSAWHTDTPLHSNVDALRTLNISFVQDAGYVNLRCNWNPGCREKDRDNEHVTDQTWSEVFEFTTTPHGSYPFPGKVAQTCCAQFAVSRAAVLRRPKRDYDAMRGWLLTTELSDRKSGRVFEFLWHVIFGMDSVHCPEEKLCYCQVYGRC